MKSWILGLSLLISSTATAQELNISLISPGNGPYLVEGCSSIPDTILFTRSESSQEDNYRLSVSGTATSQLDFLGIFSGPLTFPEGVLAIKLPVTVISDNMDEGNESIMLEVVDAGNSPIANLQILVLDDLEIQIIPDTVNACQGESVDLYTDLPGIFTWIVLGDTINEDTLTVMVNELTIVKVLATAGNCLAEDETELRIKTGIRFNPGDTAFVCLGETAFVNPTVIGDPGGQFEWLPQDSFITVLPNQAIQVTTEQTRTYYLRYTNSDCSVLDSVVIRVDSLPELPITVVPKKDTYCPGEKVTLFTRYLFPKDFPNVTFKWEYDAGSPLSSDTLQNFTFTTEDTSYFFLTAINNACRVTDSVLLYVINPPVNLSLTDTTVCPNRPVKVVLLNEEDFDEIMWSPEMGISCTDCPDPTIRVPQTATFTMNGKSMGCPASGSVTVNIFPPQLILVIPDTIVCPGESVRLTSPDANLYEDLVWSGPAISCNRCDDPTVSPGQSSVYQVEGTTSEGCLGIGGITVRTYANPVPFVSAEPAGPVEIGTLITLSSGLGAGNTYTWTVNGQPIQGNEPSVEAAVISEGPNEFKVIVVSANGCMGMGSITVTGNPPKFEIPSAFTPNGDMTNDSFKVLIFGNISLREFKVFNRWGQIVFEGIGENGWDGRHNGKAAPAEVYAYQAVLQLPDGSTKTVRGEVTLLR